VNSQGPIDRDVYDKIVRLEIFLETAKKEGNEKKIGDLERKIAALKREIER